MSRIAFLTALLFLQAFNGGVFIKAVKQLTEYNTDSSHNQQAGKDQTSDSQPVVVCCVR